MGARRRAEGPRVGPRASPAPAAAHAAGRERAAGMALYRTRSSGGRQQHGAWRFAWDHRKQVCKRSWVRGGLQRGGGGHRALVFVDLLQVLACADEVQPALGVAQHLRRLGEAVIVLRRHARAVRAAAAAPREHKSNRRKSQHVKSSPALDDAQVANVGGDQLALRNSFGLTRCGRQQVAALAAVAHNNVSAQTTAA